MKEQGIVTNYDGYIGNIKDNKGIDYLLLKKETMEAIQEKDQVVFDPDVVITTYEDRHVARFVKKIKRDC